MAQNIKPFLGSDFLLENDRSAALYHTYAANLGILDYHNHLPPKDIRENRKFTNLTEAWLEGDHYKWRAMRANGINEALCTGNASAKDKFMAWASTVPFTVRNPLYHWTHLELRNYFGIHELLNAESAARIYATCNEILQDSDFTAPGLLKKMNVEVVCTTDDPIDSLEHHHHFASLAGDLKMYPTFRPDKAYSFDHPQQYNAWLDSLSAAAGIEISSIASLLAALTKRMIVFNEHGCRSADHGLEELWFDASEMTGTDALFAKIRSGAALAAHDKKKLRAAILFQLCQHYHAMGWVQQFHLGALRANNSKMLRLAGADSGFDSIGDFTQAQGLARFLNALDDTHQLGKTIIYNLNPAYNEVFATMTGNFNDGITPGKIQYGSAWWFLDQKDGMEKQLNTLSGMGLLSRFVGMITDSRSFLSFPRHEYFRRILCNLIGRDIVNGELPDDLPAMGKLIQDVCYFNAKQYFNL